MEAFPLIEQLKLDGNMAAFLIMLNSDRVRAAIWHFALSAPEAASAWVGLATADGILVKMMEPIPQPARLIELEFTAQRDITEDTPIYFHVSNHGANSWHLLNIQINPEA